MLHLAEFPSAGDTRDLHPEESEWGWTCALSLATPHLFTLLFSNLKMRLGALSVPPRSSNLSLPCRNEPGKGFIFQRDRSKNNVEKMNFN